MPETNEPPKPASWWERLKQLIGFVKQVDKEGLRKKD